MEQLAHARRRTHQGDPSVLFSHRDVYGNERREPGGVHLRDLIQVEDKLSASFTELRRDSVFQRSVCRMIAKYHPPQRLQYRDGPDGAHPNVQGQSLFK
jgi:hypothetical protein